MIGTLSSSIVILLILVIIIIIIVKRRLGNKGYQTANAELSTENIDTFTNYETTGSQMNEIYRTQDNPLAIETDSLKDDPYMNDSEEI
ncbi:hypothetical protein TRFO_32519 [Tritrichomonas foetus]|uniref:Uncharacterized protein n=1 Tax=Tritrichomonas foetus TaxID=1144522 RepID=A0A1J4JNK6_9EUKA|nr:hypothetical protein TRFO_32519 [Tritrichomonas foetus]|eukprot:OHT00705.1 hypothetical protein TRFO_32519 [Tritrichomonas foetus]